jgi:tetratricopeptide (TPR) repeat protein
MTMRETMEESTGSAVSGKQESFGRWMFRAYLDLGPVSPEAPHHCHGLDFGIRSLVEDRAFPRIQSALNPSFRQALALELRAPECLIADPRDLPARLRTDRWQELCRRIEAFGTLPPATQVRVVWLLSKLCLLDSVLQLLPGSVSEQIGQSNEHASLAYVRAYARCRLNMDNPTRPYSNEEFREIALKAPPGIARIDAHYQMVSQAVKIHGDLQTAEHWQELHREAIVSSRPQLDEFTFGLVMSRFHRVGGFLPQMRQDATAVVKEMDLAEEYARALPRGSEVERIAADEMLYPVYESRTKEALWMGDHDLAEERALGTVELSPYDARAWLHLGQVYVERDNPEGALRAYRRAARLAPPGREIACFMAGQCLEALGDPESACDAYLASLDSDPLGVSSVEALVNVAGGLGHRAVERWARARMDELHGRQTGSLAPRPEPYKDFAPPRDSTVGATAIT